MIGIIDYGMGNLRSLENALDRLCAPYVISDDTAVLKDCDRLILPGVGAFADGMKNMKEKGLSQFVIHEACNAHKPLLGICLGMQMLYEESEENGRKSFTLFACKLGLTFVFASGRGIQHFSSS